MKRKLLILVKLNELQKHLANKLVRATLQKLSYEPSNDWLKEKELLIADRQL